MRHSIRVLLAVVGLCVCADAPAQIVNTLEGFDVQASGWSGSLGAAVRATGGNSRVFDAAADARAQWTGTRHRYRLLGGYEFSRAGGEDQAEATVVHLRHNFTLTPGLRSLSFAQLQRNPFQQLRARTLLGAGLRIEPVRGDRSVFAFGVSHMVEIERLEHRSSARTDQRLSSFVDLRVVFGAHAKLSLTAFYQPRWAVPADFRASALSTLSASVAGPVSLTSSLEYAHDSRPPEGVRRGDWTVRTGIRVDL